MSRERDAPRPLLCAAVLRAESALDRLAQLARMRRRRAHHALRVVSVRAGCTSEGARELVQRMREVRALSLAQCGRRSLRGGPALALSVGREVRERGLARACGRSVQRERSRRVRERKRRGLLRGRGGGVERVLGARGEGAVGRRERETRAAAGHGQQGRFGRGAQGERAGGRGLDGAEREVAEGGDGERDGAGAGEGCLLGEGAGGDVGNGDGGDGRRTAVDVTNWRSVGQRSRAAHHVTNGERENGQTEKIEVGY